MSDIINPDRRTMPSDTICDCAMLGAKLTTGTIFPIVEFGKSENGLAAHGTSTRRCSETVELTQQFLTFVRRLPAEYGVRPLIPRVRKLPNGGGSPTRQHRFERNPGHVTEAVETDDHEFRRLDSAISDVRPRCLIALPVPCTCKCV